MDAYEKTNAYLLSIFPTNPRIRRALIQSPQKFHTAVAQNTRFSSKNFTFNPFIINYLQTYVIPNRCDCRNPGHRG